MAKKRQDDFNNRRMHLEHLSDEELKARFFKLAEDIVNPLVQLSEENTTPSIERSVLLRMGFSSLEAQSIVNHVIDLGLMGKGAGHVVLKVAEALALEYIEAGRALAEGRHLEVAANAFKEGR